MRFENKLSYSRNTNIAAIAGLLAGNFSFTTGFEGFTVPQTTTAFSNALTSAGFMGDGSDTEKPFAYINYILFNESMVAVDAGWQASRSRLNSIVTESPLPERDWSFGISNIPGSKVHMFSNIYNLRNTLEHEKFHVYQAIKLVHSGKTLAF